MWNPAAGVGLEVGRALLFSQLNTGAGTCLCRPRYRVLYVQHVLQPSSPVQLSASCGPFKTPCPNYRSYIKLTLSIAYTWGNPPSPLFSSSFLYTPCIIYFFRCRDGARTLSLLQSLSLFFHALSRVRLSLVYKNLISLVLNVVATFYQLYFIITEWDKNTSSRNWLCVIKVCHIARIEQDYKYTLCFCPGKQWNEITWL